MSKTAKEYLQFLKENSEERALTRELAPEDYEKHVRELGFDFTSEELHAEMETLRELGEDELEETSGGICKGHCGFTCENQKCNWMERPI